MNILFVFDATVTVDTVDLRSLGKDDKVFLFPLSSETGIVRKLAAKIAQNGCAIVLAPAVSEAGDNLREKYLEFIATLPHRVGVGGRGLKEYFAVDEFASLWWFSLIAEKNTFKSGFFTSLAQLDAIVAVCLKVKVEKIFFSGADRKLQEALCGFCSRNSMAYAIFHSKSRSGLKSKIRNLQQIYYFKHLLLLIYHVISFSIRNMSVKSYFRKAKRPVSKESMVIVTYYPNFVFDQAEKGIFKNKYYLDLQEALEAKGKKIIWVAMQVENNFISPKVSLDYARKFIEGNQTIYFLEEFASIFCQARALWRMLWFGVRFIRLEPRLARWHDFGGYNFYAIFKDDWYASMVGNVGYLGLVYYEAFKSLLKKMPEQPLLYFCEMHAWEKALSSAKRAVGWRGQLLAYQHATVSRFLLNYFNDPKETAEIGDYAMPQPDKLICNGPLPGSYFRQCGWPEEKLRPAEAIRYNYLKKLLGRSWGQKEDLVLLAFSINAAEARALLAVTEEALADVPGVQVLLRPHPFLPMDQVLPQGGTFADLPFEINYAPLEELMPRVKILIAGESGLSLEGLACGGKIITVDTPEMVNMSPLRNVKSAMVKHVASPEELRNEVKKIIKEDYDAEACRAEAEKIIKDFFFLNFATDKPEKFLAILDQAQI